MDLVFAYLAGLLTLINPCVLPVLPIVLASALQAHRLGPLAMAGGMAVSFVTLGLTVTAFGQAIGLDERSLAQAGAVLMIGFGLILLIPRLNAGFATVTAGFAARADAGIDGIDRSGLGGQVLAGILLGAVWSPCIGPTLGGAISLASQGQSLGWAGAIMTAFAAGVGTVILALGYGARAAILRRRDLLRRLADRAKPLMGAMFLAVGLAILFRWHHIAEAWLIDHLPTWLIDLSVSF
ncbi:cytochrome c biogenesis CcdA family protein [Tabrizicola thermarum]|uniref:cytochrome c biogenesis CcdA family protein n=1 Tax=Tabrizicola thermarum TaxID=2670345 RepID=UPI000FFC9F09|nr:cytochrome c biogenesis CcdA family protein [Tabrizicola thermarum]